MVKSYLKAEINALLTSSKDRLRFHNSVPRRQTS